MSNLFLLFPILGIGFVIINLLIVAIMLEKNSKEKRIEPKIVNLDDELSPCVETGIVYEGPEQPEMLN